MSAASARVEGLLAANAAFYGAFEQLDVGAMRAVWAPGPEVLCIHPGWDLCRGADEVEDSWRRIFENTSYIEFSIAVIGHGVSEAWGWVVCEETILQSAPPGMSRSVVLSTNMFAELDGQWRMTLHHGSPVAQRPAPAGE